MQRMILAALVALNLSMMLTDRAAAEAKGLGDPGQLKAINVETGRTQDGGFVLAGRDSFQQLLVTGEYSTGQVRDLTHQAKYEASPAGIVAIDAGGLVTPLMEGDAVIAIQAASGPNTSIKVRVTHLVQDVPVNFPNQIVPIFTKLGCNSGGCHGKAGGQNGFKLSLLGFEPAEDYEYLVKEAPRPPALPGRARPEPAAAQGDRRGRRTAAASGWRPTRRSTRLMRRWIEQGMPFGKQDRPDRHRASRCCPNERLMDRKSQQQLVVVRPLQRRLDGGRHPHGAVRAQRHRDGRSRRAAAWSTRWS